MIKGALYTVVFLTALLSVQAAYLPVSDVLFNYKNAECTTNGSIFINITHEGRNMRFSDIKLTAYSDNLDPVPMIGTWYIGPYPSSNYEAPSDNYTGSSFNSAQRFSFRTTHNIYTQEKYIITLSWPSISEYQNNIKFAVTCPGKTCSSDNDCISEQACGESNICEWVKCGENEFVSGHACIQRCDDQNICTRDNYINGQCYHTTIDKCCSTNDECGWEDECTNNECMQKPSEKLNILQRMWLWLKSKYQ